MIEDIGHYLANQMGTAIGLGFPAILTALFLGRRMWSCMLSGVFGAVLLPAMGLWTGTRITGGGPEDIVVLFALATLFGLFVGWIMCLAKRLVLGKP